MPVNVRGLDHLVLTVADGERTIEWYADHLGLEPERLEQWRAGEVPFASLRIDEHTLVDVLVGDRTGTNVDHVSVVVEPGTDLAAVAESGEFDVVAGPMWIWGARGHGWGLYVSDPDGNVVELKAYEAGPGSTGG